MLNSISENIEGLKALIQAESMKATFYPGIKADEIRHFEKEYKLRLPTDYAVFLTHFNGGLITEFDWPFYIDMTEDEPDSPKQSSFCFFDWEEAQSHYLKLRSKNQWMNESLDSKFVFPIFPIAYTPDQKLLFLVSEKLPANSSALFIATKDDLRAGAFMIAKSFNAFLNDYIASKGFPSSKPLNEKVSLISYFERK